MSIRLFGGVFFLLLMSRSGIIFSEITRFTHFQITELPGSEYGTAGPAVGDLDGNGDMDLVSKVWHTGGKP